MPRLKAAKRLEEIEMDDAKLAAFDPDQLFDLVMEATGNEDLASSYRVANIRLNQRPRATS